MENILKRYRVKKGESLKLQEHSTAVVSRGALRGDGTKELADDSGFYINNGFAGVTRGGPAGVLSS